MAVPTPKPYEYPFYHRVLEYLAIAALMVSIGWQLYEVCVGLAGPLRGNAWWVMPSMAILAYLWADFISGFVHFLGDRFGTEQTPLIGQTFVKPFRFHHVDPRDLAYHDFVETNGNNCIVCIPTTYTVLFLIPARTELWAAMFGAFTAWFMLWIFMTNQFHKWAHIDEPPGWITWLQRNRLILGPEHHDIHHTPPFDTYYCITTGWLNPILHKIKFFPRTEALLRYIFRQPRPPEEPEAPPNIV